MTLEERNIKANEPKLKPVADGTALTFGREALVGGQETG